VVLKESFGLVDGALRMLKEYWNGGSRVVVGDLSLKVVDVLEHSLTGFVRARSRAGIVRRAGRVW